MKSKIPVFLGLLILATGGVLMIGHLRSGAAEVRQAETEAVREAVVAIDYYLPLLLENPEIAGAFVRADGPMMLPSRDPVRQLKAMDMQEERQLKLVEKKERFLKEMGDRLAPWSGREFKRITGTGFSPPVWNIQGHHYLWGHRTAEFDQGSIPLRFYVIPPGAYHRQGDAGLEINNDPVKTGLPKVGKLRIMPNSGEWRIMVSHESLGQETSGPARKPEPRRSERKVESYDWITEIIAAGPVTNEVTGHQYCLLVDSTSGNGPLTWTDASRVAEELGGNLVAINDVQEQRWIEDAFLKEKNLWIGLADFDRDGFFAWVNTDTSKYQNWAPGEPNGRNEIYVHMWSEKFRPGQGGMWNDSTDMFFEVQGLVEFDPGWSLPND